jgi:uncharacterized protein YdaU (DUF1376 family)
MNHHKTDTWYPMYPADYLKDTLDLTLEEDAFYSRALNQVYINKGRITANPEKLQRLLRINRVQYNRCKWILSKYFYLAGDTYGNRRADIEIEKAQSRAEVARENGKTGGRPRKNPAETQRVISGIPSGNPAGYPDPNPEKSSSSSPSDPPFYTPPEFRTVMERLCRAVGIDAIGHREEGYAFQAWTEVKAKKATVEDFEARAKKYRAEWPDLPCTFNAVMNNWHTMAPKAKPKATAPTEDYRLDSEWETADG